MLPGFNVTGRDQAASYQLRTISADGSRVFFDSAEALVPGAQRGVPSVYEWERDGSGSCHSEQGCIYLLSGSTGQGEAVFIDADAF